MRERWELEVPAHRRPGEAVSTHLCHAGHTASEPGKRPQGNTHGSAAPGIRPVAAVTAPSAAHGG